MSGRTSRPGRPVSRPLWWRMWCTCIRRRTSRARAAGSMGSSVRRRIRGARHHRPRSEVDRMTPRPSDHMTAETRESISRYTFCEVPQSEARALCLERHYSRIWHHAFGAYNYGMTDSDGKLIGVAVYGHMKNPASTASIADVRRGELVELNRLWIDDSAGRNAETQLMAYAHRELRRNTPVRIIQSFADGRLGVGTIYQAAS